MQDTDFNQAVQDLDQYSDLLKDLAEHDTLEYEISDWLLHHKAGLEEEIQKFYRPNYELFPESMYYIYLNDYKREVLKTVKEHISQGLNLNPELLAERITEDFLINLLGPRFFEPPKETT